MQRIVGFAKVSEPNQQPYGSQSCHFWKLEAKVPGAKCKEKVLIQGTFWVCSDAESNSSLLCTVLYLGKCVSRDCFGADWGLTRFSSQTNLCKPRVKMHTCILYAHKLTVLWIYYDLRTSIEELLRTLSTIITWVGRKFRRLQGQRRCGLLGPWNLARKTLKLQSFESFPASKAWNFPCHAHLVLLQNCPTWMSHFASKIIPSWCWVFRRCFRRCRAGTRPRNGKLNFGG